MIKASKRILVLVFLLTFITTSITQPHQQIQANSEEKNEDESAIFIIETSDPPNEVIKKIKNQYSNLEFRKVFTTIYQGFSIRMPRKLRTEIKGIEGINRIDEIAIYEPSLQESVPFISGGFNHPTFLDDNGQPLTGKGIKVAVIDTGVDYTHPDLKDSYRGGFDVIDEDDDPMETMQEEGAATLHGTHVAGIIAANGRLKGVAPDAELYAYRTLGPTGMGTTEQVIAAIEKAIEDEVDIINLSLGNTVNGPDWPTSIALDKAVEKGVVAVTSNGNSGPNLWTVGSPGTSGKAISVGASTPPMMVPYLVTAPNDKEKIQLTPMQKAKEWNLTREYQLEFVGLGKKEAYAEKDVRGKIILAERGQISFTQKGLLAKEAGAVALIVYNHTEKDFAGMLEEEIDIPIVSIPKINGEQLKEQLTKKEVFLRTVYHEEEDFIAPFSSRGPVTHTWEIKPDLVAPGVAIDSTIPRGYLPLNGTSMSSPHVAGAAALIKQKYPNWTPYQIKAALMNTAKPIKDQEGNQYPPHVQGTGRLQLNEALKAETLIYPSSFTFGKWGKNDRRSQKTIPLTIENHSKERKKYTFETPFEVPDGIQWKVPFSLYLAPGETREVQMTIDILPTIFEEGLYYNNIYVNSGSESIAIPYLFFIEEPTYPRLMAFMFEQMVEKESFHYEVYLPGGADTFSISIYDPDTLQFIKKLDVCINLERGMFEQELKIEGLTPGIYKAFVVAEKDGQEDTIEQDIFIGEWEKEE